MEHSEDTKKSTAKEPAQGWGKEKVSALVDGEVEPDELRALIAQLREHDCRQSWDLYHEIGDAIRSAEPGPAISAGFGQRFAERFAAEPMLLPPRRGLLARLGGWPTTMAAVAAAGFGFFVAPSLMPDAGPSLPAATTAAGKGPGVAPVGQVAQALTVAPVAPVAPLATASRAAADGNDTLDYIALHHRAHASLYGAAPAISTAVLDPASQR